MELLVSFTVYSLALSASDLNIYHLYGRQCIGDTTCAERICYLSCRWVRTHAHTFNMSKQEKSNGNNKVSECVNIISRLTIQWNFNCAYAVHRRRTVHFVQHVRACTTTAPQHNTKYLYDFDILHAQIIWLIWFITISSYLYLIVRILRANMSARRTLPNF